MKGIVAISCLKRLSRDSRGANLVEYIILVGMVAVLCILAFHAFGDKVHQKVSAQTVAITSVPETP